MGPKTNRKPPNGSPKKKLHDDPLTPPKRPIFSVDKLMPMDPSDPYSDLFWGSPTGKSSSQYVVQMLDEKEAESKANLHKGLLKSAFKGGRSRSPSPSINETDRSLHTSESIPKDKAEAKPVTFLRSAFSSAQPSMTEAEQHEYYAKLYPFNYLTLTDFRAMANSIERVYRIEAMTGHKSGSRTMEAVVLYCRFLEHDSNLNLPLSVCVDLMANGGEVALYASAFNFQRIVNIELTEAGKAKTKQLISNLEGLSDRVSVIVGTMRDYFPYDAQVYYMDCGWVCNGRTMVDEFVLINTVFALCEKIEQHGTAAYLCLLTQTKELEPLRDFGARHIKILLRTVIHFGQPDECVAWVIQVLPMPESK